MQGFLSVLFLLVIPFFFKALFIVIIGKIAWPLAIIITLYLFWKWV